MNKWTVFLSFGKLYHYYVLLVKTMSQIKISKFNSGVKLISFKGL